jgi:hypothetical protein
LKTQPDDKVSEASANEGSNSSDVEERLEEERRRDPEGIEPEREAIPETVADEDHILERIDEALQATADLKVQLENLRTLYKGFKDGQTTAKDVQNVVNNLPRNFLITNVRRLNDLGTVILSCMNWRRITLKFSTEKMKTFREAGRK